MFKVANADIRIGRSKFSELKPKHVLLGSQLPRNVCLCKYHENFIMAVNTLNQSTTMISLQSRFAQPPQTIVSLTSALHVMMQNY
jgi:hypothetical protein